MARNRAEQSSHSIEMSRSWILQDPRLDHTVKGFVARYEGVGGYVGASTAMTSHRGSLLLRTPRPELSPHSYHPKTSSVRERSGAVT